MVFETAKLGVICEKTKEKVKEKIYFVLNSISTAPSLDL